MGREVRAFGKVNIGPCPHCLSRLETACLGHAYGLSWSRDRLNWRQSLFFLACPFGNFVVENLASALTRLREVLLELFTAEQLESSDTNGANLRPE